MIRLLSADNRFRGHICDLPNGWENFSLSHLFPPACNLFQQLLTGVSIINAIDKKDVGKPMQQAQWLAV